MRTAELQAPAVEPVTLTDAKRHLRIEDSDSDQDLDRKIRAARRQVEGFLGRQLIQAKYTLFLDRFSKEIELPFPPLVSIDQIRYVDEAGATQTLNPPFTIFATDINVEPGLLYLAYDQTLPSTRIQRNAVEIDFTCGYGASTDDVPEDIRLAIMHLAWHYDDIRGAAITEGGQPAKVPFAYEDLLWKYRMIANA